MLIELQDIEELLRGLGGSVAAWCVENDVQERALIRVVETYGNYPKPGAVAVCSFQLGYEAHKRIQPKGEIAPGHIPRYVVQQDVVDSENGNIVAGPSPQPAFADDVAATFNED